MRRDLQKTHHDLLEAERMATIGRLAGSISHDLRHPLTAFLAYSEFLSEGNLDEHQRKDLYQEIRLAVNRMTDLIGSLLEFSKAHEELRPTLGNLEETIQRAIRTIRARPEYRQVSITLSHEGDTEAWFDERKLERVFHNLLLNACEAVPPHSGRIELNILRTDSELEIRVADNGRGIPDNVPDDVFKPFVSYGKENGTGLGLAVVQKIVEDHGGEIRVESSGSEGTIFKISLPLHIQMEKAPSMDSRT
jgi:signal transduction histidine kinase